MVNEGFSQLARDHPPSIGRLNLLLSSRLNEMNDDRRRVAIKNVIKKRERKADLTTMQHLQLAILNEHVCLSSGYNLRFIGHASVSEILIL